MDRLPMLYARGDKNKILEWEIIVDGNSFYTISGAQGFRKVTSEATVCYGKNVGRSNETTPDQQAYLEAKARWDKRIKSKGYHENIADIDTIKFVEPMLATKLKDRKARIDPSKGLIVQIKFNGLRCVATKSGLHTRTGERYISVPHIEESLITFFERYPDAVLDGELYNWELREQLNEIVKLCRRTERITNDQLAKSERMVKYYVYDGWGFGASEIDHYAKRKERIDTELLLWCKYFEPVQDHWIYSWEELDEVYQTFLDDRQEGGMVRLPESPYERGKRSPNLLKAKPEDDDEFLITSVEEGNGNWAGKAKIIGLRMADGKEFNATFKGTMQEAEYVLRTKHNYIGRTARIFYFGFTGLGTPNYAQFNYKNWMVGDK